MMPEPPVRDRMPKLVRMMFLHAAIGFALSALFVGGLLWSDMGGLATLMRRSDLWPLPPVLLWFFTGLTFGSVQMGAAIIMLGSGDDDDGTGGGGKRQYPAYRWPALRPAPVRHRR